VSDDTDPLVWRETRREWVDLPESVALYADDLPIADILVAASGAVAALRRDSNRAEVLVWPSEPGGSAESWTSGQRIDLLEIAGFDGSRLYGNTGSSLLAISNGRIDELYRSKNHVVRLQANRDGSHLLWIEKSRRSRAFGAAVGLLPKVSQLMTDGECYRAVWMSGNEVITQSVVEDRRREVLTVVASHAIGVAASVRLLETRRSISALAGPVDGRLFYLAADGLIAGVARSTDARPGGVWQAQLRDRKAPRCVADIVPALDPVAVPHGCLFAAAGGSGTHTTLVYAGEGACRLAKIPWPIREFALVKDGQGLLFRLFGSRGGIRRLDLTPLLGGG
jgi:hypothetical protein